MKARMQELLALLTMVVARVQAANDSAHQAQSRAERMSTMLDALSDENAALRAELDEAEEAAEQARETIRGLRERVEAGERLAELLEARAAAAELRIHKAADALGLPVPLDQPPGLDGSQLPSAALH